MYCSSTSISNVPDAKGKKSHTFFECLWMLFIVLVLYFAFYFFRFNRPYMSFCSSYSTYAKGGRVWLSLLSVLLPG